MIIAHKAFGWSFQHGGRVLISRSVEAASGWRVGGRVDLFAKNTENRTPYFLLRSKRSSPGTCELSSLLMCRARAGQLRHPRPAARDALGQARDRALRRRPQSRISPWAGAAGPISIALCCAAVKREASSSSTAAAQQAASAAATKEETGGGGGSGGPAPPPEPDYLRHAPPLCSLYRP